MAQAAAPVVTGLLQQGLQVQAAASAALEALVPAVLVESVAAGLAELAEPEILLAVEEIPVEPGQAPVPVLALPSVGPAVARIQAEVTRAAGALVLDANRRLFVERFEHFVSVF